MPKESCEAVFVFTDAPRIYGDDLNRDGAPPVFVKEIGDLLDMLKTADAAGLVLETPKVMSLPRKERDRLFKYAGRFPTLRTRPSPRKDFAVYLDPRDCFFNNLDIMAGERCRSHRRIAASLECSFSMETDPSLAEPKDGTVLDISPGGCFVAAPSFFPDEHFVNLRIPKLGSGRPIFCSVRWVRKVADAAGKTGMGLMFIDIQESQLRDIDVLQMEAGVQKDA